MRSPLWLKMGPSEAAGALVAQARDSTAVEAGDGKRTVPGQKIADAVGKPDLWG